MQKKRIVWFAAPVAVAVMAGAWAGSALASTSSEDPARVLAAVSADDVGQEPFAYATNESGQTFGSLADATSVTDAPDLVLVELPDGSTGYVLGRELLAAEGALEAPSSPEEALRLQAARTAGGPVELAVYAEDGVTVIGTFEVQTGEQ